MPSPFPGMNPYIERAEVWQDFHDSFMPFVRDVLAPQVPSTYYVKIEEHVFIHERSAAERRPLGQPDLSVLTTGGGLTAAATATAPRASAPASVLVPSGVDEVRLPYLEIRDRRNRQVVTVIELLSPANKYAGPDRDQYWNKVRRLLGTPTSFVEIDLLRGGPRMPWVGMPACDYYALASRYESRPRVDFWPVLLRERLPEFPIPLRVGEPEPVIDLQAVLHRIYDSARYELSIYDGEPEPQLSPEDATWAAGLRPAR
jgi:hypothetical protein